MHERNKIRDAIRLSISMSFVLAGVPSCALASPIPGSLYEPAFAGGAARQALLGAILRMSPMVGDVVQLHCALGNPLR
jgi:hypothetical protein